MFNIKGSLFTLFSLFPIAILAGNLPINSLIFLISLIFLFGLVTRKVFFENQNKIFFLLAFFLISLLINLAFSNNYLLSAPRVIKFCLLIFFITSFRYLVLNLQENQINKIYKIWSIIFGIVVADLIIEFFKGTNIIGLSSLMPGNRLGSFTGEE
ncbi:hypothetical protein OAA56_01870, partial [Candidatus Pelagibacter sp.]|nr:hypothetical protein [Candidatus Pelagibacter sp.]